MDINKCDADMIRRGLEALAYLDSISISEEESTTASNHTTPYICGEHNCPTYVCHNQEHEWIKSMNGYSANNTEV